MLASAWQVVRMEKGSRVEVDLVEENIAKVMGRRRRSGRRKRWPDGYKVADDKLEMSSLDAETTWISGYDDPGTPGYPQRHRLLKLH